jgi:WD40 repeat protein
MTAGVALQHGVTGKVIRTYSLDSPFTVFSPDGKRLALRSAYDTVKVWDVIGEDDERGGRTLELSGDPALSAGGTCLAFAGKAGFTIWDAAAGRRRHLPCDRLADAAALPWLSPDGRLLGVSWEDGTIQLWDTTTGDPQEPLRGHTKRVTVLAFSPDGKRLASVGEDNDGIRLWDIAAGKEVKGLPGAWMPTLTFSPDGRWLAASDENSAVKIYDTEQGAWLPLGEHQGVVSALAFSPDGGRLAVASDEGIKLWDVAERKVIRTLSGQDGATSLAFSADGQRLASAGFDPVTLGSQVKVWDPATGQDLLTLTAPSLVAAVAFSRDGARLCATGSEYLKYWSAEVTEAPVPSSGPAPEGEMGRRLARKVRFTGFDDPKTTVKEILGSLADHYELKFEVDEAAFEREGVNDVGSEEVVGSAPLPAMDNVPLLSVLTGVLSRVKVPSGAVFVTSEKVITISTRQREEDRRLFFQEFKAR